MVSPITWNDFTIMLVLCVVTMLACRVLPLFVLKGKELPPRIAEALSFIPPAAFAALVANDLFTPGMFDTGFWPAGIPLLAALVVVVGARLTKSVHWCALAGVAAYGLLSLL